MSKKMRMVLLAGLLMMALFAAVISAVNAGCPRGECGVADSRQAGTGPAG